METGFPPRGLIRAAHAAMAGGLLLAVSVPFTVSVLVLSNPWFTSFFSGLAVVWPIGGGAVEAVLGYRAIQAGRGAKAGVLPSGLRVWAMGWIGIVGSALLLGGLLSFMGGAVLLVAGGMFSRLRPPSVSPPSGFPPDSLTAAERETLK